MTDSCLDIDQISVQTRDIGFVIGAEVDLYISAMQALSKNQDGLVAAGILEDGADGGNISPILDQLFTQ